MTSEIVTEQDPSFPSGLWVHNHLTTNFDEAANRATYWMIRNKFISEHMSDEEVKNIVVSLKELSIITFDAYISQMKK